MAAKPSSQAAQAGLAIALGQQLATALPGLDLTSPDTFRAFAAYLSQLVKRFGQASATLAVRQYAAERAAAGVTGTFRPVPADPAGVEQVTATLGWATAPLRSPEPTASLAQVEDRITIGAEKLVLDAGRQTIVDNTLADRHAKGWARVTEPDPCAFCALLATRGAVYRSEHNANFRAHDRCRCHAEPVFNAYEPSAQVREWQALYAQATRGVHGMKPAQAAWRKAFADKYGT